MSEIIFCFHCKKSKSAFDFDYSNFKFQTKDYCFPNRIILPKIPEVPLNLYICADCASKIYPLYCNAHGKIKESYRFGKPPVCRKCENDLDKIRKDNAPNSFKAIKRLSKLSDNGIYLDQNIWFAISNDSYIHLIGKQYNFADKIDNFDYEIKFDKDQSIFSGKHKKRDNSFELIIRAADKTKNEFGRWMEPWVVTFANKINGEKNIYFSELEYITVSNLDIKPNRFTSSSTLWALDGNEFLFWGININLPKLENLQKWFLHQTPGHSELRILFQKNNIPSLLLVRQPLIHQGVQPILNIRLPESKRSSFSETELNGLIGTFDFKINGLKTINALLKKEINSFSLIPSSEMAPLKFDCGYSVKNYLVLLDSYTNGYAVSMSGFSIFPQLLDSIPPPCFLFENDAGRKIICMDERTPGKILAISFFDLGFVIDGHKFEYIDIQNLNFSKIDNTDNATLELTLRENKSFKLIGPEKYIRSIWEYFENNRQKYIVRELSTNELYQNYNELKKENILIGLLSDIVLVNKELDAEISIDELKSKLDHLSDADFCKDKNILNQTIKKLLIFSNLIPKIKKDYVLVDAYYPHYQLKNELDFIKKVFNDETMQKIEDQEFEIVMRSSRQSIGFLQNRFNKTFQEIERAITPVENIFFEKEVQKDFIAKAAKYAAQGGQLFLIGGLIVAGGALGGIGVLSGMLGIRAMSDILSSLQNDNKANRQIKSAAQKAFGWWKVFKEAFPITIYEIGKMIDRENKRCVKRDNDIFKSLKGNDGSVSKLNEVLKLEIEQLNQIRFKEILENTGMLFDEVIKELNEKSFKISCKSIESKR